MKALVAAVMAASLLQAEPSPAALVARLRSSDSGQAYQAQVALEALGPRLPEALPELRKLLRLDTPEALLQTALKLVRQMGRAARPAAAELASLLGHPRTGKITEMPAYGAASALAGIGPAALPELLTGLDRPGSTAAEMGVRGLVMMGVPATPGIRRALGDPRTRVRAACATALGLVRPLQTDAAPDLKARLRDPELEVRFRSAEALCALNRAGADAAVVLCEGLARRENPLVYSQAPELLAALGELAVPALLGALSEPGAGRQTQASRALGLMRPLPVAAVNPLVRRLESGDGSVRAAAAHALGQPVAVPQLRLALRAPGGFTRLGAASALARIGPEAKAARAELQLCLNDENAEVRVAAAGAWWSVTGDAEGTLSVARAALQGESEAARIEASNLCGTMKMAAAPAIAPLRRAANDPSQRVRAAAIEAIPEVAPDDDSLLTLTTALGHVEEETVADAIRACERILEQLAVKTGALPVIPRSGPQLGRALLRCLDHPGPAPSYLASQIFRLLPNPPVDGLRASLANPRKRSRLYAAQAIGSLGKRATAAIPDLEQALRDPDPDVRRAAARAVEQIKRAGIE